MYKVIRLFIIVVILMLSACGPYKPSDYMNEVHNLTSEQVIEFYFNAWNEKHYGKMNAVLSDEMKARTVDYDSVESISVVSSEQITISELPDTVERLQEVIIYCVEISTRQRQNNSTEDEISTVLYYVGKQTNNSPWLIYEVQQIEHQ